MPVGAEVKTIVQDWILISYDIPASAKSTRRAFLKAVHALGGEMHTASVYLMPYSEEAMGWANELESAGHAVVWRAQQTDPDKAEAITAKYEAAVKARCDYIEHRLEISQDYIAAGKLKMAEKMAIRTTHLLGQVVKIAKVFNPPWLQPRIEELYLKMKHMYGFGKEQ